MICRADRIRFICVYLPPPLVGQPSQFQHERAEVMQRSKSPRSNFRQRPHRRRDGLGGSSGGAASNTSTHGPTRRAASERFCGTWRADVAHQPRRTTEPWPTRFAAALRSVLVKWWLGQTANRPPNAWATRKPQLNSLRLESFRTSLAVADAVLCSVPEAPLQPDAFTAGWRMRLPSPALSDSRRARSSSSCRVKSQESRWSSTSCASRPSAAKSSDLRLQAVAAAAQLCRRSESNLGPRRARARRARARGSCRPSRRTVELGSFNSPASLRDSSSKLIDRIAARMDAAAQELRELRRRAPQRR